MLSFLSSYDQMNNYHHQHIYTHIRKKKKSMNIYVCSSQIDFHKNEKTQRMSAIQRTVSIRMIILCLKY